jgi:hypothetical protein
MRAVRQLVTIDYFTITVLPLQILIPLHLAGLHFQEIPQKAKVCTSMLRSSRVISTTKLIIVHYWVSPAD